MSDRSHLLPTPLVRLRMPRLKWFLIGAILSILIGDWVRLRAERNRMFGITMRSVELAERRGRDTASCLSSLRSSKDLIDSANFVELTRVQTAELLTKSQSGDADSKRKLVTTPLKSKKGHYLPLSEE